MAKSALKVQARQLRSQGESVKVIAKKLGVSKSSASLWVRDIILSVAQLEKLHQKVLTGAEKGRLQNAFRQKEKRLLTIDQAKREGLLYLSSLTAKEMLIAGLAIYWGEGSKRNRKLELCNSDPKMIQFFIRWLQNCLGISVSELKCYVGINESHSEREKEVKEYWSKLTNIPLEQFTKTSFKKVKSQKVFENFDRHYGTLSVKVVRSARFYYKVLGLIDALASQGSSVG